MPRTKARNSPEKPGGNKGRHRCGESCLGQDQRNVLEIGWWWGGHARALTEILQDAKLPDSFRSVVYWMASGGRTVFLQDANSLMLSTESLVEILNHIRREFPQVERITSYARGITLKGKSVDEFIRLKEAG